MNNELLDNEHDFIGVTEKVPLKKAIPLKYSTFICNVWSISFSSTYFQG